MADKLMIIDGNSILNRAFYGLQGAQMSASDGLHTNAIFGFINILNKYLEEEKPQYLCVAFDLKAPTFRHLQFEGYKATRKGMPPELAEQVPYMKEVLDAMNIKRLEMEGFEADDIIGSVSKCAEAADLQVVVVTGDRDSLQLASESTKILLPITRGGRTETETYNGDGVREHYGVTPLQFIDVKGLMGDKSDNIPGVPGIGEKTALELIKAYGSIENVYDNLNDIEKKSVREKLETNRELAFMSKHIATIERNMPTLCQISELKRQDFNNDKLYELFRRLDFKSFIEKLGLSGNTAKEAAKLEKLSFTIAEDPISLAQAVASIRAAGEVSVFQLLDRSDAFSSTLAGMALSWGNENVFVPVGHGISEEQFLELFSPVFSNKCIKIYGHDLKNLIVWLKWKGISFDGLAFDTMIGAYILNPSRDTYTVAELAQDYLGHTFGSMQELTGKGKGYTPFAEISAEQLAEITVRHSRTVMELTKVIGAQIAQNDQTELYFDIELPLVEVLSDMEYRGFKVNTEGLKQFSQKLDEKITASMDAVYTLAGEEFNINSPKQLGVILFEKLGLPVLKKTKTGYSTDAEVLEQLASRHEIVTGILEYRQLVKLKSTYAEGLLHVVNPADGRIHSSFNQTVTATGRISSTEPNLQNIPIKLEMGREIRKVFVPENDEFLLSDADYSQIELRVLAHITGDENMTAAFKNNEDIHTATASSVFNVPKEQVSSLLRSRAKAVNFGIVYGIGDFSLAKDLGITRKEAREYIDGYLEKYPGVKKYMHETVENGKNNGYVETMFKRRRYLPELKSSNFNLRSFGERVAMNMPIQGSAADIIKIAMVKVYKELGEHNMKSRLILQVHDELIIETHKSEKEQVEKILQDCMQNAVAMGVPLLAEVKTGASWYETK
ncbi:MAG TPA: DNA polymerase I [Clostridia bacterium]|nr:DNA polymerase I [Clostridia bacterium]